MNTDDSLSLLIDGLRYTLDHAPEEGVGRVVVRVELEDGEDVPFRDRCDLVAFKARRTLAKLIADAFGREVRETLGHLTVLLDQVERARAAETTKATELTAERRASALELLKASDLLDKAAAALEAVGYVGEDRAKRLAFLVATSRLLTKPMSAIVLAPSGSGKSELLDAVAKLMPPEAVEFLSRITPAALFYAGPDHLRHKLVVVDEQAGSAEADYAIRTLQSKGLLRLAIPMKGKTESFEARGPIALMSGTTSSTINPENLSRCLQLALDDSPEQTRRIQQAQRQAWAGKARAKTLDVQLWQDAQRVLEPLDVLIPFAERLTFPARTTHDRRGNQKLLGLVAAHALLCQHQREHRHSKIVATPEDYRVVHGLLARVVDQERDGLSPRAARLNTLMVEHGSGTRRDFATLLGWSYNTARRALDELLDQELAAVADHGPPRCYRLLGDDVLGTSGGLLDPEALA